MSPLFSQSILMLADSAAPQLPTGFNSETQKAFSGSAVAIFAGLAVLAVGVIWAVFFRKSDKQQARGVISESKGSGRRRRRHRYRQQLHQAAGGEPWRRRRIGGAAHPDV